MKQEPIYLKTDSRNRISLTKVGGDFSKLYRVYRKSGTIVLEPVIEVPAHEAWLYLPENKETLESIKRGLSQKADIYLGSFAKKTTKKSSADKTKKKSPKKSAR